MKRWPAVLGAPVITGVALAVAGILRNDPCGCNSNGAAGAPLIAAGAVLAGIPLLALITAAIIAVIREAARDYRQYQAWKATLSPEALGLVRVAEAAAIFGGTAIAQHELRRWGDRVNASVTETQVNGFGG